MPSNYPWQYMISGSGASKSEREEEWKNFRTDHGVFETEPFSNKDFDPSRVAEMVAEENGLTCDVCLLLQDRAGNRWEVEVTHQKVDAYVGGTPKEVRKK